MNRMSFTFARIRGIPIRAHVTLLLVAFLFLQPSFTARAHKGTIALVGLAMAVLFVGSILLHELGHAYQASREGMRTEAITLWALGGMAFIERDELKPGPEFRVAVAGPVVTGLLALLFGLLGASGDRLGLSPLVRRVLYNSGSTQQILLVFNLIPAFPLDGGRMLMAAIWKVTGNLTTASRVSSAIGKGFGVVLMAIGVVGLLSRQLADLLPAALRVDSFFAILIGFFFYNSNRGAPLAFQLSAAEGTGAPPRAGPRVADYMVKDFVVAAPDMTVAHLLEALSKVQIRPIALVLQDGAPVGMISRYAAEKVAEQEREARLVSGVMTKKDEIRVLQASDTLAQARRALESGPETAVVLQNDVVVGLLSVSDVARAMVAEPDK